MAFQLEDARQPVKKSLKLALYGPPGTGKTHIGLSFPEVVVVDTEAGTDFFRGRVAPFRVLKTKDYGQVLEVITAIETGQLTAGTLMIDSFTVLNDVLREAAFKAAEKRALAKNIAPDEATVTPRDWGKIKAKLNSLMTRLYNLPCHTVITGWIKDQYEGEGNELKKIGTIIDADKKILYQPDVVLELAVVKGKHVAFVRKDRTGTWGVDQRLTDVSFPTTFAPLVDAMSQGTASSTTLTTEEEAAEQGSRLFEAPGVDLLRDTLRSMGIGEAEGLWLIGKKLGKAVGKWADVPVARISGLIDSLVQTDPEKIRDFVAQNYPHSATTPSEVAHG